MRRAVEKCAPSRNKLKQEIELDDVARQHRESQLLGLQEERAVLQRLKLRILSIALQPAEHASEQRCPSEHVGIGRKHPVIGHRRNLRPHRADNAGRPAILWTQHTDRVHQFLDCDSRVIHVPRIDELLDKIGRTALHLVDINARIEQECLACDFFRADERKLGIVAARERVAWVEARPTARGVNVKPRHVRSRASGPDRRCRARL